MSYSFTPADWKKIEGHSFDMPASSNGVKWVGHIPGQEAGRWPRAGGEAICLRVKAREILPDGKQGREIESVIKIFFRELVGRQERFNFLVQQKLAKQYPWMFRCVPFSSFGQTKTEVNGQQMIGHLSRYVGGSGDDTAEDFDRLKQNANYDVFGPIERRQFVADLATAVLILESKDIAHGDLSDGNVLIARIEDPARHAVMLCDFDGFHHASVRKLPRKRRPLGSIGYTPPFLIDRLKRDTARADESICIASDRFALAVLACELMCWSEGYGELLKGRDRLLDVEETLGLRDGSWSVPDEIIEQWPAGFDLLSKAAKATDWHELPSSREWLDLIGMPISIEGLPFTHPPLLKCRRAGMEAVGGWHYYVLRQANGPMRAIGSGLANISYKRDDGHLSISLPKGEVALIGPLGRAGRRVVGPAQLKVNPSSRLIVGGMEMEVLDKVRA